MAPPASSPMSGDVIGFVLAFDDVSMPPIYITGDTVWYDGVAEVARRFRASASSCCLPAPRRRVGRSI